MGCGVVAAENGIEAVELAPQGFGIIFMDLSMPAIDGFEASRRTRALPSPTRQAPIVAITARTDREVRLECLEAGMDMWLPKPVTSQDLWLALVRFTRWKSDVRGVSAVDTSRPLEHPRGPDFLTELAENFRYTADGLVDSAQRAFAVGDLPALRSLAEQLGAAAAVVCAAKLMSLCDDLTRADVPTLQARGSDWLALIRQHAPGACCA